MDESDRRECDVWGRYEFKRGDRVARADGAWAEVLSVPDTGYRLRVRYTGDGGDPSLAGTEDELVMDDVISVSPAPPGPEWGNKVTVVVHYVPESEEFEGGYESATTAGVPENVIVTGTDGDSAEGAVNHLIAGLRAFGFSGRVAVEDATVVGRTERYETEVPRLAGQPRGRNNGASR